jgi:hypothetical protein
MRNRIKERIIEKELISEGLIIVPSENKEIKDCWTDRLRDPDRMCLGATYHISGPDDDRNMARDRTRTSSERVTRRFVSLWV